MSVTEKAKVFDEMLPHMKLRAMGALEREEDEYERLKPIRDEVEKYGHRCLEITEFGNYHFVKFRYSGRGSTLHGKEMYEVFINGKRCHRITNNPKMLLVIALAYEYDGINTQADRLIAQMLGIKEEDE